MRDRDCRSEAGRMEEARVPWRAIVRRVQADAEGL